MPFHSFKTSLGKSAFGGFNEPQNAGEYTNSKTINSSYCDPVNFNTKNKSTNNNNYYISTDSLQGFNKMNLASNLITKLDLQNFDSSVVPVIQKNGIPSSVPTNINITSLTVPYMDYTIDPCGNLFGNTVCGINNYRDYLVYNLPYTTDNPESINNL